MERPLVFHLFGRLGEPDSLVITEDDYFDYLIGVTSNNDLIPGVVRRALADSALLFLGFGLDDWDFRVLFRSIINRQGSRRRNLYAHVAAQIDPEAGRIQEPEGARRYLESYFDKEADISIFWGSVGDFTAELAERLKLSSESVLRDGCPFRRRGAEEQRFAERVQGTEQCLDLAQRRRGAGGSGQGSHDAQSLSCPIMLSSRHLVIPCHPVILSPPHLVILSLPHPVRHVTMTNTRPNPYPGPRSFQQGEKLYGRQRETWELLNLLIAERIVLLVAPSGAGKTSLVQAALAPELEKEGFRVLPDHAPRPAARRAGAAGQPLCAQPAAGAGGEPAGGASSCRWPSWPA